MMQRFEKAIVLLSMLFHVVTVKLFKYWPSLPPFACVVQPQLLPRLTRGFHIPSHSPVQA
jgi:hypothetical protein